MADRVCDTWLESGEIDARLANHAEDLSAYAIFLVSLIGRLKVPSFEEWKAANSEADREYVEGNSRGAA